ncbi:MAG: hypothetical protein V4474_03630 [Patescibacteria group bacterium]
MLLKFRPSWDDTVFLITVGGNLPLAVGGWSHPSEINTASYSIWLIIASMLVYSSRAQGASVRLPLGFVVGNVSMLVLAYIRGGSTFNLGAAESLALYGVIGTLCIWLGHGASTGRWSPKLMFYGAVFADVLSFYPQAKQYIEPHEPMTWLGISCFAMWLIASSIVVIKIDRMPQQLREILQRPLSLQQLKLGCVVMEKSLFPLEQIVFIGLLLPLMMR